MPGEQFWGSGQDNFGIVRVSVQDVIGQRVIGSVTFELRDRTRAVCQDPMRSIPCRTTWNLDTDELV